MRRRLKAAVSRALSLSGAARRLASAPGAGRLPLIVGYHRVVREFPESARSSLPAMLVSTRMLEHHLDWLARRYRITTLDEIGAHLEAGRPGGDRLAAVTFDDGYADLEENALPILSRKGIPATVFVVADLVGSRTLQTHDRLYLLLAGAFRAGRSTGWIEGLLDAVGCSAPGGEPVRIPPDPARAARTLLTRSPREVLTRFMDRLESIHPIPAGGLEEFRALDWEMVDRLRRSGVAIGSHTRTHPLLTLEDPSRIRDEVEGSRAILQRRLGASIRHFAYPDGRFHAGAVSAVEEAGYRYAFGICRHRDAGRPLLTIPRRILWEGSCVDGAGRFSPHVMECSVLGLFDRIHPCRRDHGATASSVRVAAPAARGRYA